MVPKKAHMYTKISFIRTINPYMFRSNIYNLQRQKIQKLDSLNVSNEIMYVSE